jgi:hypothetical protein
MIKRTHIGTVLASLVLVCLGLTAPAQGATGNTGSRGATASCSPGSIRVSPTMNVVQSVRAEPMKAKGQHVAYQALLYRWDGKAWVKAQTSKWLWGYASGGLVSTFRSFETSQPETASFSVGSGYYGVIVRYYWYANEDVSAGEDYALAQHVDMGGPNGNGWCKL